MTISKSHSAPEAGSALFMVLISVALFAALSFALSQQSNSSKSLSTEKAKLLATEVIDMGAKMADTVAQMRLRTVKLEQVSFQNDIVTNYDNLNCTTEKCRVFSYDGGGRDWEIPVTETNESYNWAYTGDISIQDVGTTDADLVAILPNLSLAICTRLNKVQGVTNVPTQFNGVVANKYVGAFATVPINLTSDDVDGRLTGCIRLANPAGSAIDAGLPANFYAYYQVLAAR